MSSARTCCALSEAVDGRFLRSAVLDAYPLGRVDEGVSRQRLLSLAGKLARTPLPRDADLPQLRKPDASLEGLAFFARFSWTMEWLALADPAVEEESFGEESTFAFPFPTCAAGERATAAMSRWCDWGGFTTPWSARSESGRGLEWEIITVYAWGIPCIAKLASNFRSNEYDPRPYVALLYSRSDAVDEDSDGAALYVPREIKFGVSSRNMEGHNMSKDSTVGLIRDMLNGKFRGTGSQSSQFD
ncbi:hypothetical protein TeGR_g14880 [Tetraparma gracilis]|uniref:Uncharacterized protein n=1 Tax=Tetraparma gracilis TaxID=2962635 RepID=A0ABQ6MEN7_9STRA|nr:hypothetical protein TeGR_g14880 [Tetraparma gracilis]